LYLYIYVALFAVHPILKCFKCERPRQRRAVLRTKRSTSLTS